MQFYTTIALLTALISVNAALLEARTDKGGIQCNNYGGKWHYGWDGASESEKYTCNTIGLLVSDLCLQAQQGNKN
jgi:hypothetical protein